MHISTSNLPIPFTPKCLGDDSQVIFWVAPPTQADVDALGSRLFMHNIAPISTDTFRAIMIDEIFKIHGDEKGEDLANLMDEFWQSEDLHRDQLNEWRLQDAERLFDIAHGAPHRDAEPVPVKTMSLRRRTRAQLFSEEMRAASVVIRQKTIDLNDHDRKTQDGITRLLLTGWSGAETAFDKREGIVDAERFSELKAEIGALAIAELHQFVAGLLRVDGTERGNSGSPLANGSDPTGSPAPSGASASSDGNSTGSGIIPTPSSESGATTAPSSTSTSGVTGESESIAAIQTAAG